jgi:ABC-2 type transport system ATP-binding protein
MLLAIKDVNFNYGKLSVLTGVHMNISAGEIHGLVGVNGSGKTTLLRLITGLLSPLTGSIQWDNRNVRVTDIIYMESNLFFYPNMTGRDYLDFFSANNKQFRLKEWNEIFQLPLDEFIDSYSSGMQRKLSIMGVLALDRPVLLLDEPFNALDLEAVELLKKLVLVLKEEGKTILLTSHVLETLTGTCDEIHYLNAGTIRSSYTRNLFDKLKEEITAFTSDKYSENIQKALRKSDGMDAEHK